MSAPHTESRPQVLDLEELAGRLREFAEARDWQQFHAPKNLAMALIVEAAELVEHFQWSPEHADATLDAEKRRQIALELADVQIYLVRLADRLGIDLARAVQEKIALNESRYPVALSRGRATKYTEL